MHAGLETEGRDVTAKVWGVYELILADLDGVVYEGKNAIDGAPEVLGELRQAGVDIGYVTNNSSRKAETIVQQIAGFGVSADPHEIIGSAQTGVELLATLVAPGSKVLVVGGEGLRFWVESSGFELVASADDKPDAVIQGFAPDVAWRDLAEAAFAIQGGAKWVATNSDWTLPQERGLAPGNGTLVSAVHTAVGQMPLVAGKPEPAIFNTALRVFGLDPASEQDRAKTLFIGDRIDTDIVGANKAGLDSILVLTGVSQRKDALAAKAGERPTYILENLRELRLPYAEPKQTKRGFACLGAEVELLGNRVVVTQGDAASIGALRAAAAVIWGSGKAIYTLDVEPALYL